MLYQKMLVGERPYHIAFHYGEFEKHNHFEIELAFCIYGEGDVIINRKSYRIKQGDLAIIGSMNSHEFKAEENVKNKFLIIEAGPMMLLGYFDILSKFDFSEPLLPSEFLKNTDLYNLLCETVSVLNEQIPFSELIYKGNIYKIFSCVLKFIADKNSGMNASKNLYAISEVEKSIEYIYSHYDENIKIETVADFCGYSKSNFCKIFKNITGDTFHNVLNNHRIEIACNLLKGTNFSIEEIAQQTGFLDSKSFCRVFKIKKQLSPGAFRKKFQLREA